MKISIPAAAALLLAITATGCSDPSFTVKGTIEGAEGKTLILEHADHAGIWVALDSTHLKKSGSFSFSHIAPADPEIYRLSLDGRYVYFPIDSIETITIDAPAADFATGYTVSGSEQAQQLARFEKQLIKAAPSLDIPDSARAFKRRVFTEYLQNARGSVVSYYILTKTINGQPLFRVPEDGRYIAAVATAFREYRPDDPRLGLLTESATQARRADNAASGRHHVVEASEISYIDISLPDTSGAEKALSSVAGKGTPTVLIFSNLSDPATPALNAELRKLRGVNIYNVSFDADQLAWHNAAANLPWTCVYASDSQAPGVISSYQVNALPTIYVIDAAGNLRARCTDMADLRRNL